VSRLRQSWIERFVERISLWRAVRLIVSVAIVLVLVAALIERLVEPETFSTYGKACWWAVETITTVGYGDVVPHSPAGRTVAAILMLVGISLIPTVTSMVVSTLISKRSRASEEEAEQDRAEHMAALARIEERLAQLESPRGPGA
jgi:voltage-gated potassium channel